MTSPEGVVLAAPPSHFSASAASPFASVAAGAAQQPEAGAQQPPPQLPTLHLFPGLPRSRSDAAAPMSSTPTLRPIVPLPPPPPRRSTNLSQRVQEQVGCCLGAVPCRRGIVCRDGPARLCAIGASACRASNSSWLSMCLPVSLHCLVSQMDLLQPLLTSRREGPGLSRQGSGEQPPPQPPGSE